MTALKKCPILCLTALLILSMVGCQNSGDREVPSSAPSEAIKEPSSVTPSDTIPSSNVILLNPTVNWETKEYENTYLKFQIPSNWEENPDYSDEGILLTFFSSLEATTDTPSNVNIQITNLQNQGDDIDYGDAEIQDDFHKFLTSGAGLPSEAKDGTFTVYQTPEFYVYALSFLRETDEGITVKQTTYLPVGMDYAIVLWATDWNDGATPSVDEIAMHICATLELKDAPAK